MIELLWKKLQNALFGFTGTLIYCPKCTSKHVGFGPTVKSVEPEGNVETYPVHCKDCGAKGTIKEVWK